MVEWVLEFKICALSGALDGSEDDQIMCIKYGSCKDLLARLQGLEESDVDPFEAILEDDVLMEDVADLHIDRDEYEEIIID
eukprot:Seg7187.4 transcript_id=Seg7187.4/GoldUCD/mRNA.D3Y31 product="hypothetical protein" pseudo=true protein_id=Seg7187.4/GoldUCD/D3Y31